MVEFFAPWCGACKSFAPTYKDFSYDVKQQNLSVKVSAVNVEENPALRERYKIESYPTLMFFSKHQSDPIKFTSIPGSSTVLLDWVKKLIGNAVTEVDESPKPVAGGEPIVVLKAKAAPPGFLESAQELRVHARCFW